MPLSQVEQFWFGRLSGLKLKAEVLLAAARRSGKISNATHCEECGWVQPEERKRWQCLHAHHDDYTKPLDVRWLCAKCHRQWHGKHGGIYEWAMNAAKANYVIATVASIIMLENNFEISIDKSRQES